LAAEPRFPASVRCQWRPAPAPNCKKTRHIRQSRRGGLLRHPRFTREITTKLERVKGIEPSYSAWKAAALPLSYTREELCHRLRDRRMRGDPRGAEPIRQVRAPSKRRGARFRPLPGSRPRFRVERHIARVQFLLIPILTYISLESLQCKNNELWGLAMWRE
jgi:hypothetical protein